MRRLATIMSILGMFAVFALPGPGWAADEFFSGLPDLPVMPELVENRDAAVIFDKPEGRIVTLAAAGRVSREAVSQYYARVLPQLGWNKTGPNRFQRDGEILGKARKDARSIIEEDPMLTHTRWDRLRRMVLIRYGKSLDLSDLG